MDQNFMIMYNKIVVYTIYYVYMELQNVFISKHTHIKYNMKRQNNKI